ncbi:MAG: serine hydrolase [Butyrivibrio sp.]|nr:serine hydrolase [Butyrivibrio sp.]
MFKEELHRFISESKGNESNICQICVIRDEEPVYEDCWRGFRNEDAINVNSVTKGVMAILAGIAVDKGSIKSLDEKVISFFPDYQVKRGEKTIYDVTIRHLLTMTAPYLKLGERFGSMEYGYLWYKPYEDREVYAAIGDSGNIIYVNKEANLSVGITGTFKPRIFDRVEFIEKKVIRDILN